MDVLGIKLKGSFNNEEITIGKENQKVYIQNKVKISSEDYLPTKKSWKVRLKIQDNKISYVKGDDIYFYYLEDLINVEKVFSKYEVIYAGISIKEVGELTLKFGKPYLASPSKFIKIGKGKVATEVYEGLVNEKEIIKLVVLYSDGLIFKYEEI